MDRLLYWLADAPFLLALFAAALAEMSSSALRRASSALGRWAWTAANGMAGLSGLGLIWSWIWAVSQARMSLPARRSGWWIVGSLAMMAGAVLILLAVRALGRRTLFPKRSSRLETKPPYRYLRRPMGLGLTLVGLGAAIASGGEALWIWLVDWFLLWQPLFELEEWELKARLPSAQAYLAKTPRYIPWRFFHGRRKRPS
jgi:protein-S-isoprenylcysteine O-methyltransferase Ste14